MIVCVCMCVSVYVSYQVKSWNWIKFGKVEAEDNEMWVRGNNTKDEYSSAGSLLYILVILSFKGKCVVEETQLCF